MGKLVTCECFEGFHCLDKNCYNGNKINTYINQYETDYLKELLGCEMASQLCTYIEGRKNDPNNTPINEDLELIINPFCKTKTNCCGCDCNNCEIKSKGLKWMLTGFVYYHISRDYGSVQTGIGAVKPKGKASDRLNYYQTEREAETRYNDAVCTYQAIQYCIKQKNKACKQEEQKYPLYNGCNKECKLLDII